MIGGLDDIGRFTIGGAENSYTKAEETPPLEAAGSLEDVINCNVFALPGGIAVGIECIAK